MVTTQEAKGGRGFRKSFRFPGLLDLRQGKPMNKRFYFFALVSGVLLFAGVTRAQYPIMDRIADKVVQKYQNSTCEQLWQKKGQPKSQEEQRAVAVLRGDPQMRAAFINRVAGPIANKMFECGMIP
jgi:hypothetical protein